VDRDQGLDVIQKWATESRLARITAVANDATLLLAAGTPEGFGVAIVCGTGTIAFVRSADGQIGRCGGWGYLLGDEGSGYRIAQIALQHVCRAYDGCAEASTLTQLFLQTMQIPDVPELIPAVYRGNWDRIAVAGLATLVLKSAQDGDVVAQKIVTQEIGLLTDTVASAIQQHWKSVDSPPPLALSGSLVLRNEYYRELLLKALHERGLEFQSVELVHDPASGAIAEAARLRRVYAAR
jgi:N-acetylglucosamine kinase-like BadF-type ATPase